jgi:hypothetical protein
VSPSLRIVDPHPQSGNYLQNRPSLFKSYARHPAGRPVLTAKTADYCACPGGGSVPVGQRGARLIERRPAVSASRSYLPFKVADPRLSCVATAGPKLAPVSRRLRPLEQQPRQLGDVGGDAPELVTNLSVLSSFPSLFRLQQSGS